jgi:hypothetical protein
VGERRRRRARTRERHIVVAGGGGGGGAGEVLCGGSCLWGRETRDVEYGVEGREREMFSQ